MKTLTLVAISMLGLLRCNAEENKSETSITPAAQEFLKTLPEIKRLMLEKFEKVQKEKASEILKTRKIPKTDNNQYEKQFYFSRDYRLFYVQEVLLSEDGKTVGVFFSELSLDKNGRWFACVFFTFYVIGFFSDRFVELCFFYDEQ